MTSRSGALYLSFKNAKCFRGDLTVSSALAGWFRASVINAYGAGSLFPFYSLREGG